MIFVIEGISSPTETGLRIGMWNVRSMNADPHTALDLIIKHNFHIFAVAETWLQDGREIYAPLPGYSYPIALPRSHGNQRAETRGGGLLLYIKDHIKFKHVTSFQDNQNIQFQYVRITKPIKFDLINVYVPPALEKSALSLLNAFLAPHNRRDGIVILGDFNMSAPKYETELQEIEEKFGVKQLIQTATHGVIYQRSILDHIYVSTSALHVLESGVMRLNSLYSDHRPIYCTLRHL